MLPRPTVEAFGAWLKERSLRLEAVIIGGAALGLLGITDRQTRDVDVLDPELPKAVAQAARDFASHMRDQGVALADNWLNNGPTQVADVLPEGWRLRVQLAYEDQALKLLTLGRGDLLKTKLFALCDRGTDLGDCLALGPSVAELDAAEPWLVQQDANPLWPNHVRATLDDLRRRLGHGLH